MSLPQGSFAIEPLGTDKYVLFGATSRVVDASGNPVSEAFTFTNQSFVMRDDGTLVAFVALPSADPTQPGTGLDGQALLAAPVIVAPQSGGMFADSDGDGDLDFNGTLFVGHRGGQQESLRLQGGSYELTEASLKVTNATVFANIGDNTTSALFRGSFALDRNSGVASSFVVGTLDSGETPFTIAGLSVIYRGLTVRPDGAAFPAAFQLPILFFDGSPRIDLNSPNALLINDTGPEVEGFEVSLGAGEIGATLGDALNDIIFFNLFDAEAKNLKIKYDGALNELGISGELKIKSDIVEGLSAFIGLSDVEFTFKDFKVRDGLYDFEGEVAAKEWSLGPVKLKDVKFGIKIDDSVLQSVNVEAGIKLPFKQLEGLSFAGQALFSPLTLNKIGLTAETVIPLSHGFFLDKIGATLDHLAGSPPEPTPTPTTFTGLLGIGWGPKIPEIEFPEALGIDTIEDARPVNIELTASTDWTTSVTGTGKINLYKDELGKYEGSITWDWQNDTLTLTGGLDYFSGIITGTATARFSELGYSISGTGGIALPNASLFGPLAGLSIGSASILTQALEDSNPANDLMAAWGMVTIPVVGSQTVGVKINLKTADVDLILSASDVPQTNSFDVLGNEDWLMISAAWDNPVTGPVLTQVRLPDGITFIQEADYAANGITLIDLYTGPTKKTVVIDNPAAGNWDLQVIDPSGLQNLDFRGFTPNPAVDVAIGGVALALGATSGQVDVSLAGADPGTNVTFYADTDAAGLDGFVLGGTTRDADGDFTFDFSSLILDAGVYHLYAIADDGANAPDADYGGTFVVAHRPADITLAPKTAPTLAGAAALIAETALPGSAVAALAAVNPDLLETHTFTLLDDAGGRFAIVGDQLVVGTGAPFDAFTATSHDIVIRATTSHALVFDEAVTIEVGDENEAPLVIYGSQARDTLLGGDLRDVFFGVSAEDVVIGRGAEDVLYLDGLRSDFQIVLDATGALTGPVQAFPMPDIDPAILPPHPLDPQPPYVLLHDLRSALGPIVTAGIEILQFRDLRLTSAQALNSAPQALADGPYAATEDTPLAVAANGVLANDTDADGSALTPTVVAGPANGSLTLNADGSFTYTPDDDFNGTDSFSYRVQRRNRGFQCRHREHCGGAGERRAGGGGDERGHHRRGHGVCGGGDRRDRRGRRPAGVFREGGLWARQGCGELRRRQLYLYAERRCQRRRRLHHHDRRRQRRQRRAGGLGHHQCDKRRAGCGGDQRGHHRRGHGICRGGDRRDRRGRRHAGVFREGRRCAGQRCGELR